MGLGVGSLGALWYTERTGALTKLGGASRDIAGVSPIGEGRLTGLEIDRRGRIFLMYAWASDAQPNLAPDPASLYGKVLKVDPNNGGSTTFTKTHRNPEGLCFAPGGRFLATEHGPTGNDEINVLREGFDGGWPGTSGNGIRNYSPSVAPAGCAVYGADLIPPVEGLDALRHPARPGPAPAHVQRRRISSGEEVLHEGTDRRVRDVAVGPDGAVYLTSSNQDGRGTVRAGDDKIPRIAPAR